MSSTNVFWCLDNLAGFYWQTKTKVSSLISGGVQSEIKTESHKSDPTAKEIFIAGGLAGKYLIHIKMSYLILSYILVFLPVCYVKFAFHFSFFNVLVNMDLRCQLCGYNASSSNAYLSIQ